MSKKLSTALCLAALVFGAATPIAATAAEAPVIAVTASVSEPPLSLTPEEIAALQGETTEAESDSDKSAFDKASDFVTDNAPFIIIGIIVLAAILAGIFIMRGRNRTPKAAKGAKAVPAGAPASVPSASEIRRRKRAAMQRSREEERLRRKAGLEGRQAVQSTTLPLSANVPVDPVEAEKQSARDQLQAAAAVARSGPVPAPASPSQTAPTPGVVQPSWAEPDTALTSPTPTPEELSAATAAASAAQAEKQAAAAEAVAPVPATGPQDPPTQVYDVPSDIPEQEAEPAIEAPGLDATVGQAAAAFAAGAAGGGLAARAATSGEEEQPEPAAPEPEASDDPADDAARDAEQRLRAKVAEIKAEQGRGLSAAPVPPPAPEPEPEPEPVAEPAAAEPEPVETASMDEKLDQAEEIQREIESAEVIPPTPTGLAAVEQKLQKSSDERDRTLREAEARLRRIEQRAEDAERRAAFAERLAQLKIDESERERRMNEVITGIDRAEERAIEAEERAKAAEEAAASALEDVVSPPTVPATPVAPAQPVPPVAAAPPAPPAPPVPSAPPAPAQPPAPAEQADETPIVPAPRSPLFGSGSSGMKSGSGSLNLNSATFEELRDADLSVTQATRILAYRERFGGYRSVEDLEKVPGFPAELIESLRGRITV